MTLTKADIIEEIRTKTNFIKKQSLETVETLLDIIKKIFVSGEGAESGQVVQRDGRAPAARRRQRENLLLN